MTTGTGNNHKSRTLCLCGALHAFTHIYHVALMPLYLLIQRNLKLASVEQATLLLTLMMSAYFAPSYGMGVLADRFSRKKTPGDRSGHKRFGLRRPRLRAELLVGRRLRHGFR